MSKINDVSLRLSIPRTTTPQRALLVSKRAQARLYYTGKSSMHVKLGYPEGIRHRIMLDRLYEQSGTWRTVFVTGAMTACGVTIVDKYYSPLDDSYDGSLCTDGCFTPGELKRALEIKEIEAQRKTDEDALRETELAEYAATRRAEGEERLRQYRTGESPPVKKPDTEEK